MIYKTPLTESSSHYHLSMDEMFVMNVPVTIFFIFPFSPIKFHN